MVTNAHHIINSALTGSRSPAGPRRLGTATRISASLFRWLSVFFESTPSQGPKAAKCGVLIPGPGMFVNVQYVSTDFPLFPSSPARFFLFWVKSGSGAVERISGAANHAKKICLKSPKMKKHLHRTFACGASFCRAENGRKRGWNVDRGRSDDISCRKKYISCRRPHKARKRCYTEELNLKNCPGAPPDP